jgi:hypothetical protein
VSSALLVAALVASQTAAPAPDVGSGAKEPNTAVAALVGGTGAVTGAILGSGVGLLALASASGSVEPRLLEIAGAMTLISTPLVTAAAAGIALNLLYGEDCATYPGVLAGSMVACVAAYACAAAIAAIPLLLLAGSGGGNCGNPNCGNCHGDPCGDFDLDFARSPREEVMGGIMGAGIGLAVGSITGGFFPLIFVEAGGTLPSVGLMEDDPGRWGLVLGSGMGLLLAGVGSAIGVVVETDDEEPKKKTEAAPKKTVRTYEVPLGPDLEAALAY